MTKYPVQGEIWISKKNGKNVIISSISEKIGGTVVTFTHSGDIHALKVEKFIKQYEPKKAK